MFQLLCSVLLPHIPQSDPGVSPSARTRRAVRGKSQRFNLVGSGQRRYQGPCIGFPQGDPRVISCTGENRPVAGPGDRPHGSWVVLPLENLFPVPQVPDMQGFILTADCQSHAFRRYSRFVCRYGQAQRVRLPIAVFIQIENCDLPCFGYCYGHAVFSEADDVRFGIEIASFHFFSRIEIPHVRQNPDVRPFALRQECARMRPKTESSKAVQR